MSRHAHAAPSYRASPQPPRWFTACCLVFLFLFLEALGAVAGVVYGVSRELSLPSMGWGALYGALLAGLVQLSAFVGLAVTAINRRMGARPVWWRIIFSVAVGAFLGGLTLVVCGVVFWGISAAFAAPFLAGLTGEALLNWALGLALVGALLGAIGGGVGATRDGGRPLPRRPGEVDHP